jgi:dephospho-CoA kinase
VTIDADRVGHQTYRIGTVSYHQLVQEFGTGILADDGTINRKILSQIVFGDSKELEKLASIVWPAIYNIIESQLDYLRTRRVPIVVVEAATLVEAKWTRLFHEVLMLGG